MPRIIPYEQRTTGEVGSLGPGPVPRPFSQGVVIGAMAEAAQGVVNVFRADAVAREDDFATKLDEAAVQLLEDQKHQAQEGAADFTTSALSKFDDLASSLVDETVKKSWKLNRGQTRRFIEQRKREARAMFEGKAKAFEATEAKRYRIQLFSDSAARLQRILEADPDRWREAAAERLAAIDEAALLPAERAQLRAQVHASMTEGAVSGWMRRDPRAMLAELDNPATENVLVRELAPEARERVRKAAEALIVDREAGQILEVYERDGAEAGLAALGALAESDLPALLRDDVRNKVNTGHSRLRDQRRQEHADELAGLETSIANETAGRTAVARVEQLYELGALTPQQYATYLGRIESSMVKRARQDASARELAAAIQSGLPLDPRDADHRKALAQAFAHETQGQATGSPEWQYTAAAYAARTRLLPEQAIAWTRQTARSPDPRVAAAGAQFYGAIAAASPDAVGEIDSDTKAFAAMVNGMIEAGTDPARAVETARTTVFDLKPEVRERRDAEFREYAKQSDQALANLIDRDFDPGWFASPPAASAGLAADFASQSERYFQKTGDIALARDLAWQDLKRVYGPSRVNGDAIMIAFPPERFGVSPEEIRAEIGQFLADNPQFDGSSTADIYVVPDAITQRQVASALDGRPVQPSYKLVTKSGDLMIDRNGMPKRYLLPGGEELAARLRAAEEAAAAETQQKVERARQERLQRRQERQAREQLHQQGIIR